MILISTTSTSFMACGSGNSDSSLVLKLSKVDWWNDSNRTITNLLNVNGTIYVAIQTRNFKSNLYKSE